MDHQRIFVLATAIALFAFISEPVSASFHFMQIEQVIGGVNGDTTAQAIQLRMRFFGQNFLAPSRIRVWDANGQNPIVVVNFPSSVSNGSPGARVLIASISFPDNTSPPAVADFTLANVIPQSYLAAGSMTFETNTGAIVYWRLSWGGASYTGSNSGSITNDANGNFGPPFPGPLPSSGLQAVRFQGSASALSTNNAADYALTAGATVFTNNDGSSFVVTLPAETGACCDEATGACSDDVPQGVCVGDQQVWHESLLCDDPAVGCIGCPQDLNGDGDVGPADLASLLDNWGPCPDATAECVWDVNGDGDVGPPDLASLLDGWGSCPLN